LEQVVDEEVDKNTPTMPVIYEDKDESDEENSEDAMETDAEDEKDEEVSDDEFEGVSDTEGSDGMID
jgi:U3 small nucleolar RNA-associated protein 5